MSKMLCSCGNRMWDGDGHIVYDVFNRRDIVDYIENGKMHKKFEDIYWEDNVPFYDDKSYFWLCDECKKVHMQSEIPKYCYRTYELRKNIEEVSIEEIKKLDEYYVININKYGLIDEMLIKDFIEKNPINAFKYYVTENLTKVYIINTDVNKLEMIYDLTYENFTDYSVSIDSFENLLIYTIDKVNDEHEYIVENGVRKQKDRDDYPHKEVNFMITEKGSNGGSISYKDPNRETETYTIKNMNEFNKKYSKYYKNKNKK